VTAHEDHPELIVPRPRAAERLVDRGRQGPLAVQIHLPDRLYQGQGGIELQFAAASERA
jgi:hypothetical protein